MKTSRLVKTKIKGMVFWYDKSDSYVGQIVALGKYEDYESRLLIDQIKEGDSVVDIGANIGFYTLLMARKVGNKGKVFAFEPEKKNFSILVKNIESNGLRWVLPINAAVSNKKGKINLFVSEENFGDHRIYQSEERKRQEVVETISLDDYFKKSNKISLLKIDTQGWEPRVIEGAKGLIERLKPSIFLEYWPNGYKMAATDGKGMFDYLCKKYGNGFSINDYFNTYRKLYKENIEGILKSEGREYLNIFFVDKLKIGTMIDRFGRLRWRKIIKSILQGGDSKRKRI